MSKSAQYLAAEKSLEERFPVLFGQLEGADCVARPHRSLMGGESSIYDTAIRSVSELAKHMPQDFMGPLVRVRGFVGSIPLLESKPHGGDDWQSQAVIQRHQMTPPTPVREEEITARPIEPTDDELVAHVRSAHVALRAARSTEEEFADRAAELAAKADQFDALEDRLITARQQRKDQLVRNLAADSKGDLSEIDARIASLRTEVETMKDTAEATCSALADVRRSLETAKKRRIDCEKCVTDAVARWARYEQAFAIDNMRRALEKLGTDFANLAALDSLMAEGNFAHLTKADAFLRELSKPFVGQFALDGKPSWAFCRSPSQLPGVAEAREHMLARLSSLEVE